MIITNYITKRDNMGSGSGMVKRQVLVLLFVAMMVSILMLTGLTNNSSTDQDIVSAATAPATAWSIAWNKTYTQSNLMEVDSVLQTPDGGYLLGGTSGIGSKIAILKVDSSGNFVWNKTYDGVGNHLSKWLIPTNDGNFAVAGQFGGGFWLAKIDAKGNLLWTQSYMGNGFSWATSLAQTSDGGYALIGQTGSSSGQSHSSSTNAIGVVWLLKTDSSGKEQWNSSLGQGVAWSVVQNGVGGFAIAGTLGSNLYDWLLIATDSSGNLLLTKTYGSQDEDACYTVVLTNDGGYALGGWMWLRSNGGGPNYAIVKTDASGNAQWTKYFGPGFARYMELTTDGGFVLVGTKLVKSDDSGSEQWEINLQTNATGTEGYSVIETQDGAYAVAGFDGSQNGWLAKITSTKVVSTVTPSVPEFTFLIVLVLAIVVTALHTTTKIRTRKL